MEGGHDHESDVFAGVREMLAESVDAVKLAVPLWSRHYKPEPDPNLQLSASIEAKGARKETGGEGDTPLHAAFMGGPSETGFKRSFHERMSKCSEFLFPIHIWKL
jgi:hypothetical protein